MTDQERRTLKEYCQKIIENPRPIWAQPNIAQDGRMWCEDWEIIEILKYFFNGKDMYYDDPPPNRLKNNPLWSKQDIERRALELRDLCARSVDKIIEHLTERRSHAAA
jgi:hypothetical protein